MQKGSRYSSNVQNPVIKPRNEKKAWTIFYAGIVLFFALVIAAIIAAAYGLVAVFRHASTQNAAHTKGRTLSPTPFPFQELTIPYLRSREYHSQLGERNVSGTNVSYTSYLTHYDSDGLRINGLMTIPTGDKPATGWPAIVFVHGYIPPSQYATLERYVDYVDYLARNGFVVFKIDLRGHGDSQGTATGAYYSSDYIIDTLNAVAALQTDPDIDPQKIGLWGHSMAGNVTLRSLAVHPTIPAVAIWGGAVFTYSDRLQFGIQDNSYRPPSQITSRQASQRRLRDMYGEFDSANPFWKQVTPITYLADIKGAISLYSAVDDEVVNIGYSRGLNKLLDKTAIAHELHEYPSGGHNISGSSFNVAMQDTVDFYHKYLK
ncbi:alpha/beta fold hydrolase [Candidatus Microgenomates bacterium]|nr:alpha/beta fold hydrolase [Candidatus Microgenomates bacterium]